MGSTDVNVLPVLWRRPGCYSPCFQPPCCGLWNRHGWSAEAPPPSLGSAQELAFLLFGHTYIHMIFAIIPPGKYSPVLTYWSVQSRCILRGDCSRVSVEHRVSTVTCRHHQQNTNTRPRAQYGRSTKSVSVFQDCDSANRCHMELRWWRWIEMTVYVQSDTKLQPWNVFTGGI